MGFCTKPSLRWYMKEYPFASSLLRISFQFLGWTRCSQLIKLEENCRDHYHPWDILLKSSSLFHTLNKGYCTVFSLLLTNIGRFLGIYSYLQQRHYNQTLTPGQGRRSLGLAVRLTFMPLQLSWPQASEIHFIHPQNTGIFSSHQMRTKSLPSEHYEWTHCSLWQKV